jgi:ribose transport system permease protein
MNNYRFLTDYGMILVLLILCTFFSIMTYSDQSPTGEAAAHQVVSAIRQQFGKTPRVLIAASDQPGDLAFAASLERQLSASGAQVLATVQGEPKDARGALVKINAADGKLDAIACTEVSGSWLVFSNLKADFPALGEPRVITPRSYRWPNFLKS